MKVLMHLKGTVQLSKRTKIVLSVSRGPKKVDKDVQVGLLVSIKLCRKIRMLNDIKSADRDRTISGLS